MFDPRKMSVEEFFGDLKTFKTIFEHSGEGESTKNLKTKFHRERQRRRGGLKPMGEVKDAYKKSLGERWERELRDCGWVGCDEVISSQTKEEWVQVRLAAESNREIEAIIIGHGAARRHNDTAIDALASYTEQATNGMVEGCLSEQPIGWPGEAVGLQVANS
ncbi:unnamed protein product [Boreogadus saida]